LQRGKLQNRTTTRKTLLLYWKLPISGKPLFISNELVRVLLSRQSDVHYSFNRNKTQLFSNIFSAVAEATSDLSRFRDKLIISSRFHPGTRPQILHKTVLSK